MSAFKLKNIERVNFTSPSGGEGVSMIHTSGGVSVDGVIVATTGVSAGNLRLTDGSITVAGGTQIDFGSENLITTGGMSANSGMSAGTLVLSSGSITDTEGTINFEDSLVGTGTVDFSGGVSLSGGVSINSYVYPTSLGTSQFLYYKDTTTGVSGYDLVAGTNISLTYGDTGVTITGTSGGGGGATNIDELTDAFADATNVVLGVSPRSISGNDNVGVGVLALNRITTGSRNIALGSDALITATTTNDNIGIGHGTLVDLTTDDVLSSGRNIAIGTSALNSVSSSGIGSFDNVVIGHFSGKNITNSLNNTIVGASAGTTLTGGGGNNTIIGSGANSSTATISNEVTLGNGSVTSLRCADTSIASLSDARDKNDIRDLPYGLNFLENVRPVEFTWDKRVLTPDDENDPKQGKRRAGFIAQELQEAMPDGENDILDLVYESNPQRLEAKYGNLIPVMVKAIQDLKEEVDTLKNHLNLE